MFTENKINGFQNRIAALDDKPHMPAQQLKEYFDSSAEELRIAFNGLCDELSAFSDDTFADVEYTAEDGKLTFTLVDGTTKVIDLPLELLVESGAYNAQTQSIVLTLANGDTIEIPAGDLVDVYAADGQTLVLTTQNGIKTFSVKSNTFAGEANADGKLYARKDGAWEQIFSGLAPMDTQAALDAHVSGICKVNLGIQSIQDLLFDATGYWMCDYGILLGNADDIGCSQTLLAPGISKLEVYTRRRDIYDWDTMEGGAFTAWQRTSSVAEANLNSKLYGRKNGAWTEIGNAAPNGDYGLVKLGGSSKGIGTTTDGTLILTEAATSQIDSINDNSKNVIVPKTVRYAVMRSTHQSMSDGYNPASMAVPANMTNNQGKLPASYDAVKAYVDGCSIPSITAQDMDTTYSGIFKTQDGFFVASYDLYEYDTDEDEMNDTYDLVAYQMWITPERIRTRTREDYVEGIPQGGLPKDADGKLLFDEITWENDWNAWKALYQDEFSAKQDTPYFQRYHLTYSTAWWTNQPPETVDTTVFSTEEAYRVCTKDETGADLTNGNFRLMTDYDGYANPITGAGGTVIEFTKTADTPAHNGIVAFNSIGGVYKFYTPDYRLKLRLYPGYIYDIYMLADVRGDLGGGTVMNYTLPDGQTAFYMNGSSYAGVKSDTLNLMTGNTSQAQYKRLYLHTKLTYSTMMIGCDSAYRQVNLANAAASAGTVYSGGTQSACVQASSGNLTQTQFELCLHPAGGGLSAQQRGVLFKGTKIYVTGRKIHDLG